jgi:hypothetical protein
MSKLLRLFQLAFAVFLLFGVAAGVLQAIIALTTAGEIDYGEGIVMWQAANVTNWAKAFHPIEIYPHNVFHYTPLFHLTSRVVNVFTGNLLVAGRLTSLLSLLGTCLVAGWLVARVLPPTRDRFARFIGALTAGTLVFATPIWWWASLMRVDALAIFLSVCGIACFVLARKRPAFGYVAFFLFVAAVYAKQTSLAAPAACAILAFIERPRYALKLLAFSVSLGLAILLMLQTATDGLFLRHIITYNQNPYYLEGLFAKLREHAGQIGTPLFFSVVFPVALIYQSRKRGRGVVQTLRRILSRTDFERCVIVAGLYFLFASTIAAATISKVGAWYNYYLEMDVAACLLSGLFLGWLLRRDSFRHRRRYPALQAVALAMFLIYTFGNWAMLQRMIATYKNPPWDDSPAVVKFLKQLPEPVYSEDMVVLMQAGKEVPAEPAIITALARNGTWDESGFVAQIRRGEFHAIVIRNSLDDKWRFSEAVVSSIHERYYRADNIGRFQIYLPK